MIPNIFEILNSKRVYNRWSSYGEYNKLITESGKASDCIECGQCEGACPQALKIIDLLKIASETFEKK
jgi:predicted aldo/keto reductase-like oxidoreductase